MEIIEFLDVREREGKKPIFTAMATLYINDNGKYSLYLPLVGRFYPGKKREERPPQNYSGYDNPPPPADDDNPW